MAFIQALSAELQKVEEEMEASGTDGVQGKGDQVEPVPCSGAVCFSRFKGIHYYLYVFLYICIDR